jgi:hypothetical protein
MLSFLCVALVGLAGGSTAAGKDGSTKRALDGAGTISSFAGQGDGATDGLSWAGMSVAADSSGNVYIAADSVIRRVDASTGAVSVVAGDGTDGYSGDGGPATSAELSGASAIAVDSSGNLFIADSGNAAIREVAASTGDISTIAGDGSFGFAGDGGPATSAEFSWVYGVTVDSAGNVYVDDSGNCEIRKIDASDGTINDYAGNATCGDDGDGGAATNAELGEQIYALAVDGSNNLYISDSGNDRIRKVDASTGTISTVVGTGDSTWAEGDGGPATGAPLCCVSGIAFDSNGNLYVASWDAVISKVDVSDGTIHTVAGNWQNGDDGNGGLATDAEIADATALAFGGGSLYFAQDTNNYIRKISDIENAPVVDDVWPTLAPGSGISISGSPQVGSVLTIAPATWEGSPTPTITHSWMSCDPDGTNCTTIDGATDATYTVTSDDLGHVLEAVEIASNQFGGDAPTNTDGTVSAPTAAVGSATSTSPPTVAGTFEDGQTLTADPGTWSGDPTSFAYQWQRCPDGGTCSDITGATSATYATVDDDVSAELQVDVTATNAYGSTSATSGATVHVRVAHYSHSSSACSDSDIEDPVNLLIDYPRVMYLYDPGGGTLDYTAGPTGARAAAAIAQYLWNGGLGSNDSWHDYGSNGGCVDQATWATNSEASGNHVRFWISTQGRRPTGAAHHDFWCDELGGHSSNEWIESAETLAGFFDGFVDNHDVQANPYWTIYQDRPYTMHDKCGQDVPDDGYTQELDFSNSPVLYTDGPGGGGLP